MKFKALMLLILLNHSYSYCHRVTEDEAKNYIKNMSGAYYNKDFNHVFTRFNLANRSIDNKEDGHVKALFDKMKFYVTLSQIQNLISQGRDADLIEKIESFDAQVFHDARIKGITKARIQLLLTDKSEKAVKKKAKS